jgi:hypothetical protein
VKIDVEGAEPQILSGLLPRREVRFVLFEAANNQSTLHELFLSNDFELFGLERTLMRPRVTRIGSLAELGRFHDVVAVRGTGLGRIVGATPSDLGKALRISEPS